MFEEKVAPLHFPSVVDSRGMLLPVEFDRLDFVPARIFFVSAPSSRARGGHAHRRGCQLLVRLSGEVHVRAVWRASSRTFVLDSSRNALLVRSPVWAEQTYWGDNAMLAVLSDVPYDPEGYILEDAERWMHLQGKRE